MNVFEWMPRFYCMSWHRFFFTCRFSVRLLTVFYIQVFEIVLLIMTQQDIRGSYDAYIQIQGKLPVRLRLLPARSMRLGLNLKKKIQVSATRIKEIFSHGWRYRRNRFLWEPFIESIYSKKFVRCALKFPTRSCALESPEKHRKVNYRRFWKTLSGNLSGSFQ